LGGPRRILKYSTRRGTRPWRELAILEERFGFVTVTSHVIASEPERVWVKRCALLEDGRVEKRFYEGGSEEVERIRREVRQGCCFNAPDQS
jgi:hypothetical protein